MPRIAALRERLVALHAAAAALRGELEAAEARRHDVLLELRRTLAAIDAALAALADAGEA